jgi:hypothetical protein
LGVPEINPVEELNVAHDGSDGEIVYPFELTAPPLLETVYEALLEPIATPLARFTDVVLSVMFGARSPAFALGPESAAPAEFTAVAMTRYAFPAVSPVIVHVAPAPEAHVTGPMVSVPSVETARAVYDAGVPPTVGAVKVNPTCKDDAVGEDVMTGMPGLPGGSTAPPTVMSN